MSVLINYLHSISPYLINMEMPTSCNMCWALDDYGDYPRCRITDEQRGFTFNVREKRMDKCPLVYVPPHGRLVDADALIEDLKYDIELDAAALDSMEIVGDERKKIQDDKDCKQNCIFLIESAPTIIEAEEE